MRRLRLRLETQTVHPYVLVEMVLDRATGCWVLPHHTPALSPHKDTFVSLRSQGQDDTWLAVVVEDAANESEGASANTNTGTWVLPTEILNARRVWDWSVCPSVVRLFATHPWLARVRRSKSRERRLGTGLNRQSRDSEDDIPLPDVGFTTDTGPDADAASAFKQVFGNTRSLCPAYPWPETYYYFRSRPPPTLPLNAEAVEPSPAWMNRYAVFVQGACRAGCELPLRKTVGVHVLDAGDRPNLVCASWMASQCIGRRRVCPKAGPASALGK